METNEPLIVELKERPLGFLVSVPASTRPEQYFVGLSAVAAGSLALTLALLARAEAGAEAGPLFRVAASLGTDTRAA
jgi:hypothetical protein